MPYNPESKLNDLKTKLQGSETELREMTKERDTLKSDIAALEKIVNEVNQAVSAYGQALQNTEKDRKAIQDYSDIKTPMIEAAVKDKKDAIDAKIKEADDQIKAMEKEVIQLEGKSVNADTAYENTKRDRDKKQDAYNALKALQKTIGDNLKEHNNLKQLIDKAESDNKPASMYFLDVELNKLLSETKSSIKTQEDFKSALNDAWTALDSAETALRDRKEKMTTAQTDLDNKEKELDFANKNRRTKVLEAISNI